MRRLTIGLLAAAPLCTGIELTAAQETPHPMYYVRQEFVRAALVSEYEGETRRWLSDLGGSDVTRDVQWVTVVGPELGYAYVVPIEGHAGIDRVRSTISASRQQAAARWSTLGAGLQTPIDHIETRVIELRPDLSYLPRRVELDLTLPFRKYHWYHVIPGLEWQFEEMAMRLVGLYEDRGVAHGFRIYSVLMGSDLPVFLMVERAGDEVDYAVRAGTIRETVGDESDAIFGQFLSVTRRVEVMEGMTRGDLSYPPLEPAPGGASAVRDR